MKKISHNSRQPFAKEALNIPNLIRNPENCFKILARTIAGLSTIGLRYGYVHRCTHWHQYVSNFQVVHRVNYIP